MKDLLASILSLGCSSPRFNEFYTICVRMAVASLSVNRNSIRVSAIRKKLDVTLLQLAKDCIADIFETENDLFIQIKKYFCNKAGDNIHLLHDDQLKALLAVLIKSKVNQELSEFTKGFDNIYPSVKKSVEMEIKRKPEIYKKIKYNDQLYFFTCRHADVSFKLDRVEEHFILEKLFEVRFRTYRIPELMHYVFLIINSHDEFCKALTGEFITGTLTSFYKKRLTDKMWSINLKSQV